MDHGTCQQSDLLAGLCFVGVRFRGGDDYRTQLYEIDCCTSPAVPVHTRRCQCVDKRARVLDSRRVTPSEGLLAMPCALAWWCGSIERDSAVTLNLSEATVMKRVLVAGMVVMAAACGGKSAQQVASVVQPAVGDESVHINCGTWPFSKDELRKDDYTITIKRGQSITWLNDGDRTNRDVVKLELVDKVPAPGNQYLSIQKLIGKAGPVSLPFTKKFETPGQIRYSLKFKCNYGWMEHIIDPDIVIKE